MKRWSPASRANRPDPGRSRTRTDRPKSPAPWRPFPVPRAHSPIHPFTHSPPRLHSLRRRDAENPERPADDDLEAIHEVEPGVGQRKIVADDPVLVIVGVKSPRDLLQERREPMRLPPPRSLFYDLRGR